MSHLQPLYMRCFSAHQLTAFLALLGVAVDDRVPYRVLTDMFSEKEGNPAMIRWAGRIQTDQTPLTDEEVMEVEQDFRATVASMKPQPQGAIQTSAAAAASSDGSTNPFSAYAAIRDYNVMIEDADPDPTAAAPHTAGAAAAIRHDSFHAAGASPPRSESSRRKRPRSTLEPPQTKRSNHGSGAASHKSVAAADADDDDGDLEHFRLQSNMALQKVMDDLKTSEYEREEMKRTVEQLMEQVRYLKQAKSDSGPASMEISNEIDLTTPSDSVPSLTVFAYSSRITGPNSSFEPSAIPLSNVYHDPPVFGHGQAAPGKAHPFVFKERRGRTSHLVDGTLRRALEMETAVLASLPPHWSCPLIYGRWVPAVTKDGLCTDRYGGPALEMIRGVPLMTILELTEETAVKLPSQASLNDYIRTGTLDEDSGTDVARDRVIFRLKLCLQLVRAVHHVRSMKIAHCGLMPSSIMVTSPEIYSVITNPNVIDAHKLKWLINKNSTPPTRPSSKSSGSSSTTSPSQASSIPPTPTDAADAARYVDGFARTATLESPFTYSNHAEPVEVGYCRVVIYDFQCSQLLSNGIKAMDPYEVNPLREDSLEAVYRDSFWFPQDRQPKRSSQSYLENCDLFSLGILILDILRGRPLTHLVPQDVRKNATVARFDSLVQIRQAIFDPKKTPSLAAAIIGLEPPKPSVEEGAAAPPSMDTHFLEYNSGMKKAFFLSNHELIKDLRTKLELMTTLQVVDSARAPSELDSQTVSILASLESTLVKMVDRQIKLPELAKARLDQYNCDAKDVGAEGECLFRAFKDQFLSFKKTQPPEVVRKYFDSLNQRISEGAEKALNLDEEVTGQEKTDSEQTKAMFNWYRQLAHDTIWRCREKILSSIELQGADKEEAIKTRLAPILKAGKFNFDMFDLVIPALAVALRVHVTVVNGWNEEAVDHEYDPLLPGWESPQENALPEIQSGELPRILLFHVNKNHFQSTELRLPQQ
ncbi:MAG: hypothetical protein P4M11_02215 [Candidatus Pacebacteria bacterium]|nr:hypothetical protein [Candidatus Paceibacterota bacterium]